MITGKTITLTRQTFVGKVISLLLNMLSRSVITFLPRSLLISWLQSPSAVIWNPLHSGNCVRLYIINKCIFFDHCLESYVDSFVTPWTIARQAPLSMGLSGKDYLRGLQFPSLGDFPDPGIEKESLVAPALHADSLPPSCWESTSS